VVPADDQLGEVGERVRQRSEPRSGAIGGGGAIGAIRCDDGLPDLVDQGREGDPGSVRRLGEALPAAAAEIDRMALEDSDRARAETRQVGDPCERQVCRELGGEVVVAEWDGEVISKFLLWAIDMVNSILSVTIESVKCGHVS